MSAYLLAVCTYSGDVAIFDVRQPTRPQCEKPGNFDTPFRNLIWPRYTHPSQDCLLLSQGKDLRLLPLSRYTEFVTTDRANVTVEFLPAKQCPIQEHSLVVQMTSAPHLSPAEPLFVVTANSDGTAYAYAANMDRMSVGISLTAGLTRVKLERKAHVKGDDHAENEDDHKDGDSTDAILDLSNSYPIDRNINRDDIAAVRKMNYSVGAMNKYASTSTPKECATQIKTELHASVDRQREDRRKGGIAFNLLLVVSLTLHCCVHLLFFSAVSP